MLGLVEMNDFYVMLVRISIGVGKEGAEWFFVVDVGFEVLIVEGCLLIAFLVVGVRSFFEEKFMGYIFLFFINFLYLI